VSSPNIPIKALREKAQVIISADSTLSVEVKEFIGLLLDVIDVLAGQVNLNSKNSSKPPSSDPNRLKKKTRKKSEKKPGGQKGHKGNTLEKVDNPDEIKSIPIDKRTLPKGNYKDIGFVARQVFDIEIKRVVTEYRAQILVDENGNEFTAPFPDGVNNPVQYGNALKAHSVYMSQFQLLPYDRIRDYFADQIGIPISAGSIFNFNKSAFDKLEEYESLVKEKLIESELIHADETGININGKRQWLHCASNTLWTYFHPHEKRGIQATRNAGILPYFSGYLCHDHWKPYFTYSGCTHILCNAHHARELKRAFEQDQVQWAKKLQDLLYEINDKVNENGGKLSQNKIDAYLKEYRLILDAGEIECPVPRKKKGKPGKQKKSKSRNLLERLQKFEDETLTFMKEVIVPFTNNQGERDLRMTKVHEKISGCFRSYEGAEMFCLIRGYLSSCRKHGISSTEALQLLFKGELPDFDNVIK